MGPGDVSGPLCAQRESYLDRRLGAAETAAFEAHVRSCPECGPVLNAWRSTGQRLEQWAAPFAGEPTADQLRAFRSKLEVPARRPTWVMGAVSLAAVLVLGLVAWKVMAARPTPGPVVAEGEWPVQLQTGEVLTSVALGSAEHDQRIQIGPDGLDVMKATQLEVLEKSTKRTRLRLTQGTVKAQVEPGHVGRSFIIESPPFRLTVVGTEFEARRLSDTFRVVTSVGVVRVERLGGDGTALQTKLVPAGETVELIESGALDSGQGDDDSTPTGPKRAPGPTAKDLAAWRQRAARGECAEVTGEVEEVLKGAPWSVGGLRLLADCHRKLGDSQAAIAAYKKVIKVASGDEAGEAMLLAVALLEDEHGDAKTVLELTASVGSMRGLSSSVSGPLHMRRARALKVTGRIAEPGVRSSWCCVVIRELRRQQMPSG